MEHRGDRLGYRHFPVGPHPWGQPVDELTGSLCYPWLPQLGFEGCAGHAQALMSVLLP
jgi:hypothetical protein